MSGACGLQHLAFVSISPKTWIKGSIVVPWCNCYHACLHICLLHRRSWLWAPEEHFLLGKICCEHNNLCMYYVLDALPVRCVVIALALWEIDLQWACCLVFSLLFPSVTCTRSGTRKSNFVPPMSNMCCNDNKEPCVLGALSLLSPKTCKKGLICYQ